MWANGCTDSLCACMSLVPLSGVGTMLNWELFNSWYKQEYEAEGAVKEGVVPACGPATADDVLSALMKQVARERARNAMLSALLDYVQERIGLEDDPEGEVKAQPYQTDDPDDSINRRCFLRLVPAGSSEQGAALLADLQSLGAVLPAAMTTGPLDDGCTAWVPYVVCTPAATQGITRISLPSASIQGPLPATWPDTLPHLAYVELNSNALNGGLPASWSRLTALDVLDLSNNSLSGTLPQEWSMLASLGLLQLGSNALTGTLPDSWSAMENLASLYLTNNDLTGAIPASWPLNMGVALGGIVMLRAASNSQLCGPEPWGPLGMPPPQGLDVAGTQINSTCPLPEWASLLLAAKRRIWPFVMWGDAGYARVGADGICGCVENYPCGNAQLKIFPWLGVKCDSSGSIVGLDASMDGITEVLPPEMM
ncbi:hypothetical protein FOA52_004980 [Chlamydomonas sp. UWO 241]|nr:hypothetical protein FOA52_004980 [Chlamydomonas sp. UWO 241]